MLQRAFFLSVLFLGFFLPHLRAGIEDCGARGFDGTEVVKFACETVGTTPASPIQVHTSSGMRGLALVDTTSADATKFRVRLANGTIMAIATLGITTCEELQMIGNHPDYPLDKDYKLSEDIDCSATNPSSPNHATSLWGMGYAAYYSGKGFDGVAGTADDTITELNDLTSGFRPIGIAGGGLDGYKNTFNGNGHAIDGLYMNRDMVTNDNLLGLFSLLNKPFFGSSMGTVKNLGLTNVTIISGAGDAGYVWVGALAGKINPGTIDHCYVSGSITLNGKHIYRWAGGLTGVVGGIGGTGALVQNSYSTVTISDITLEQTGYLWMGGLAGSVNDNNKIVTSFAIGDVIFKGEKQTYYWAGGLVGENGTAETIENCYARGAVSYEDSVIWGSIQGGLVGKGCGSTSYSTGNVIGAQRMGGFTAPAFINPCSCSDCYWDMDTSGQPTSGCGAIPQTTIQMKAVPVGWDTSVWKIVPGVNDGYPCLIGVTPGCE